jgi:hypothetical protein
MEQVRRENVAAKSSVPNGTFWINVHLNPTVTPWINVRFSKPLSDAAEAILGADSDSCCIGSV